MKYLTPFVSLIALLTISNTILAQSLTQEEQEKEVYYRSFGKHLCETHAPSYAQREKDMGTYPPRDKNAGMTQLPMRIHIVRRNDGTGGISLDDVMIELSNLNYAMYPENVEYFVADVNYIDNTTYYDFSTSEESALCGPNQVDDAVNVFFVNSITTGSGGSACGYAYFPWNNPQSLRILMRNSCSGDEFNGTFVHEFGHHFSLYHTHQGTSSGNNNSNAEHVPRTGAQSNCTTDGDLCCDTQADPTGGTTNCVYNGGASDIYGNPYTPDEDNIMSYYSDACGGTLFSSDQYAFISSGLSSRLAHGNYDLDGATYQTVANPSGLTASAFLSTITLNWTDNANNEYGYLVERSTDGTNFEPLPRMGRGSNSTTMTDDWNVQPSTTYYYRVKASNDNPNEYSNTVSITTGANITNYTCATAYALPACGSYLSPGPSQGGGANNSNATHAVFYTFTPEFSGTLDINTCLGGTDTRVWLYTGSCQALTPLANNDDNCEMTPGSQLYASELTNIGVTKGQTIYIEFDNRWSTSSFTFNISLNATNACADAEVLTTGGIHTVNDISCGSGARNGDATHARYFRFDPPTTGDVTIKSCDEGVNTRLYVYSGTCGSLVEIANSDDDCDAGSGIGNVASSVNNISVTVGTPIYIEWDDRWSTSGFDFSILYEGNCPDNFDDLTGAQDTSFDYETNGVIVSDQTIGASASVDYDSGTSITLNPNFETILGAVFEAFIDGCGGAK